MSRVSRLLLLNIARNTRLLVVDKKSKDTMYIGYVKKNSLTIDLKCGRVYVIKATHHKHEDYIVNITTEDMPLSVLEMKQIKISTWIDKMKHFIFKHKH